jgi:hypothetical protein
MFKQTVIKTDNLNSNLKELLSGILDENEMKSLDIGSNLSKSQKSAFDLFKKGKSLLVLGSAGCGKCLNFDTPVLMYDGSVKMVQNIQKDDLLMGDDSLPRKVLNTTTGKDTMYEVKNVKGESYIVNSHHILSLKYSNKKSISDRKQKNAYQVRWFDNKCINHNYKTFSYKNKNKKEVFDEANQFLKLIIENLYVDIPIKEYVKLKSIKQYLNGYSVPIYFPEKVLDFDPYIIGLWLGDGTANCTQITSKDSSIIKYLSQNLCKYNCYLSFPPSSIYGYNICSTNKHNPHFTESTNEFKRTLVNNNLLNNKHIPMIYKCNSRENRLKLLAGLLDSDGSYDRGCYEFTQSIEHEQLMDDVIYLCRSLGLLVIRIQRKRVGHIKEKKNTLTR